MLFRSLFQNGLLPTCENIENSLCFINGEMKEAGESLQESSTGATGGKKGGKKQSSGGGQSKAMDVKLFYSHVSALF